MATLEEMKKACPTFFNVLPTDAKVHLYKGLPIVLTTRPKAVKIYRYTPSKVRPVIGFVREVKTLEEARTLIDTWVS